MSSDSGNLELALVVGFIGGIITFFKGFRAYRRYRIVEDTPEIPIRSIPMGLVHVHGKATKAAELVPSPVSHTPCCFYKVEIKQWKTDGDHEGGWHDFRTDADGPKFYLEDGSGRVLVDAHGAEYDLEKFLEREVRSDAVSSSIATAGATDAELLTYVNKVTTQKVFGFIGRSINVLGALGPHDAQHAQMLEAVGEFFKHPPGTPGFGQISPAQLSLLESMMLRRIPEGDPRREQARLALEQVVKHPPGSPEFKQAVAQALQAQGKPADEEKVQAWSESMQRPAFSPASGRYRLTEYCILPGHEYDVTGTCVENPQPADEHDRNLIMKGSNEPTFLISWKSLPALESGLRRQAALMVFGGAGLAVVCLGILLAKLGLF